MKSKELKPLKKGKKKETRVNKKLKERDIFTLLKLPEKERTKKEKKRVQSFLKRKAEIDALCTNECKVCGMKIPVPCSFCSSKHWREYNAKKNTKKNNRKTKRPDRKEKKD